VNAEPISDDGTGGAPAAVTDGGGETDIAERKYPPICAALRWDCMVIYGAQERMFCSFQSLGSSSA
jgi:hypothetical protein